VGARNPVVGREEEQKEGVPVRCYRCLFWCHGILYYYLSSHHTHCISSVEAPALRLPEWPSGRCDAHPPFSNVAPRGVGLEEQQAQRSFKGWERGVGQGDGPWNRSGFQGFRVEPQKTGGGSSRGLSRAGIRGMSGLLVGRGATDSSAGLVLGNNLSRNWQGQCHPKSKLHQNLLLSPSAETRRRRARRYGYRPARNLVHRHQYQELVSSVPNFRPLVSASAVQTQTLLCMYIFNLS
jgi:hypothetical protein